MGKLASVKTTFLTMFTKIGFLAKIIVLGIRRLTIVFRNAWPIFFVLYWGTKLTPCVLKVASKCDDGDGRQMSALDVGKCLVEKSIFHPLECT